MMARLPRKLGTFVSFAVAFAAHAGWSMAQANPPPPSQVGPPEPRPEFPKFEEVMKDYTEVPTGEPPFFELWYNKKTDSLRAELSPGLIGQKFLITTSFAGGPV